MFPEGDLSCLQHARNVRPIVVPWNHIHSTSPAQDDMSVGALEGKAADASAGLPSQVGNPSHLPGEVHRKAWAERTGHIRIDLGQVQDA